MDRYAAYYSNVVVVIMSISLYLYIAVVCRGFDHVYIMNSALEWVEAHEMILPYLCCLALSHNTVAHLRWYVSKKDLDRSYVPSYEGI